MEIITRAEAKALGLERYFTGKPCLRGHTSPRNTTNYTCYACRRESEKRRKGFPGDGTCVDCGTKMQIFGPKTRCAKCQRKHIKQLELQRGANKRRCQICVMCSAPIPYGKGLKLVCGKPCRDARTKAVSRQYSLTNKENISAALERRKAANPGITNEYQRRYRLKHPDKAAARHRRRLERDRLVKLQAAAFRILQTEGVFPNVE